MNRVTSTGCDCITYCTTCRTTRGFALPAALLGASALLRFMLKNLSASLPISWAGAVLSSPVRESRCSTNTVTTARRTGLTDALRPTKPGAGVSSSFFPHPFNIDGNARWVVCLALWCAESRHSRRQAVAAEGGTLTRVPHPTRLAATAGSEKRNPSVGRTDGRSRLRSGRGGDGSKSRNQYRKAEHSEHARSRRSSAAGRPKGERAERAARRARPTSSRDGAASTALRRRLL